MAGLYFIADLTVGCLTVYFLKKLLSSLKASKSSSPSSSSSSSSSRPSLPPGPKGLPLLGNVTDLPPPGQQEWMHWRKFNDLYGPVSSITVLGSTIVILNDYESAVELFEKRSSVYSDRPSLIFCCQMVGWENSLPLSRYGERFRQYRRAIHQFLGTKSSLASFTPLKEIETRRFLLRTMRDPSSLLDQIRRTAGAIILKMSHGYTIEPQGPDYMVNLADDVLLEFSLSAQPGLWAVDVMPFLRYLPDWFPGTSFKRVAARWRHNAHEFVERPYTFVKHQMAAASSTGVPYPRSYVSSLLEKAETPEDHFVAKWTAAGVYGGGADTTVSAIYSFYLAMMMFPAVQKRAQVEVDAVCGTGVGGGVDGGEGAKEMRLPTLADRERMPYVEAVLKEVLRWNPVAPMGLPHAASEDGVFRGMWIPKGAILMANIWEIGHNPAEYPEPSEFRPERFLGEKPAMDPRNYAFGFGRRICPGKEMADHSLWLSIALSLAAFHIAKPVDPVSSTPVEPEIDYCPGTISHAKEFRCAVEPRSERHAELVRSVEEEHPWEKSDAEVVAGLRWEEEEEMDGDF